MRRYRCFPVRRKPASPQWACRRGIPGAEGIVGDLGGGSLELVDIQAGEICGGITLPLGPLHLMDVSQRSISTAHELVDEMLADVELLDKLKGRTFYAVGGAWRNLARVHMAQNQYPLDVLHHYDMPRDAAQGISSLVSGLSAETLQEIRIVSKERSETLPYGALVLDRLLEKARPRNVVISAYGVREGLLYSKLPKKSRSRDPLIAACRDFARLRARSPKHAFEMCDWTDSAVWWTTDCPKPPTSADCGTRPVCWRTSVGVHIPIIAVTGASRSFPREPSSASIIPNASSWRWSSSIVTRGFGAMRRRRRFASCLTKTPPIAPGSSVQLSASPISFRERCRACFPKIGLRSKDRKTLKLVLPKAYADLAGERVEKRFAELATLVGKQPEIVVGS